MVTAWETEEEQVTETVQERMARFLESTSRAEKQPTKRPPTKGAWKPGESGNPNGRPPGDICITSITKEMLGKPAALPPDAPDFMKGWNWAQLISYNFIISGVKQVPPIFLELLNRVDGKVKLAIEATGKEGAPLFDTGAILEKLKAVAEAKNDN